MKILICDDQPIIYDTLSTYITAEGYSCIQASDGEEALAKFRSEAPDLIVLDLMMPKKNGVDVCKEIRLTSSVPIIMLTAKTEEIDRIIGLEIGADDYITKPFSPREVVARIKTIFRRITVSNNVQDDSKIIILPDIVINLSNYEVKIKGKTEQFTPKEIEILFKLASNPAKVFTRENLIADIWGYSWFGDTRLVDTQIKRIRAKLPETDKWEIKSVYGVGYKFVIND
jgi:DNA-binding response OmpR family regulator